MPATFGYWNIRGLGEFLRFIMEYTGEEYIEKTYIYGQGPDFDRSQWLDEKFNLGLDFPNLPYYIDGDLKLTQSIAILKHIARKHNMIANQTEEEVMKSDVLEKEAMDMRIHFAIVCYNPDFEKVKVDFIKNSVPVKLGQHSKCLGNKKWFLGDKLTYVDFLMYEALSALKELTPSSFDEFENLKQFLARLEALEPIKKYMESDRYISKKSFNLPIAFFSNK